MLVVVGQGWEIVDGGSEIEWNEGCVAGSYWGFYFLFELGVPPGPGWS